MLICSSTSSHAQISSFSSHRTDKTPYSDFGLDSEQYTTTHLYQNNKKNKNKDKDKILRGHTQSFQFPQASVSLRVL